MTRFLLALALAVPAAAAPAPDFKIARVYNAPVESIKGLADLKGKVVFLEFWATWCMPCVAGMPRTNRLIEKLKGEPVVFISVTDEDAGTIAAWLKKHEVKAWVGVDEARSSFKAYKNSGRPDGYLIGKDGALLARIFPDSLQEKDVRDALAGTFKPRPVSFSDESRSAAKPSAKNAVFELTIAAPAGPKMSMTAGRDLLEATNMNFRFITSWVWGVQQDQILVSTPPVKALDVRLKTTPEGYDKGMEALRLALQSAYGFTMAEESIPTDVLILGLSKEKGAPLPQSGEGHAGSMASSESRFLGKVKTEELARALWSALDTPVVDETGLKGEYSFDLEWKEHDRADLEKVLATTGLTLTPGKRNVKFLRVVPNPKN